MTQSALLCVPATERHPSAVHISLRHLIERPREPISQAEPEAAESPRPTERQLTLWDVPDSPKKADSATIRAARRTRLAFLRLVKLFEEHPELEFSEWLLYAIRRTNVEVANVRNSIDPRATLRLEGRKMRKKRKSSGKMAGSRRRRYVAAIVERDGNCSCAFCGKRLTNELTVDHLLPKTRGGKHQPGNIVISCHQCNSTKGDRTPEEWAEDVLAARSKAAPATAAEAKPEPERMESWIDGGGILRTMRKAKG